VFGAVIARGQDCRDVFQHFRPGFDLEKERQARLDAGLGEYLNGNDVYADVRPCLLSSYISGATLSASPATRSACAGSLKR
jgi:hypothetical protein